MIGESSQSDLAEQFGVSTALISAIVNGRKCAAAGCPVANARQYVRRAG